MLSGKLDGEVILLCDPRWGDQAELLRTASREGRVLAPCCGAPLVLKWGQRKVRHFAHPQRVSCAYQRWAEPESPEHMEGKVRLYEWCRRAFGARLRRIALEHPLPETLQRPDVYLELDDGTRYAIEYQRSVITPGEWAERHAGYQRLGICDIWIMGENRLDDALPSAEQQGRWSRREPHMHFLKLRAFEAEAAVRTPYEVAWWRGEQQEELWAPQEVDARVGREVSPWYRRAALARLRSITFMNAATGDVTIYRAMRELPGHTGVHMASIVHHVSLDAVDLTPGGLVLGADRARLERHEQRVARFEGMAAKGPVAEMVAEPAAEYLFTPATEEEEQQRRLAERATQPEWRRIVDRFGLRPENLHFMVGVPIPGDTAILVHRTVWQAYLYYVIARNLRGSIATQQVTRLLERKFGLHGEMTRAARYWRPGELNAPEDVAGRFLNLLVATGYLRNDQQSEHFRYHGLERPTPPLAFADRSQRWTAWSGLLKGDLRLEGTALVGPGGPIDLVPAMQKGSINPQRFR